MTPRLSVWLLGATAVQAVVIVGIVVLPVTIDAPPMQQELQRRAERVVATAPPDEAEQAAHFERAAALLDATIVWRDAAGRERATFGPADRSDDPTQPRARVAMPTESGSSTLEFRGAQPPLPALSPAIAALWALVVIAGFAVIVAQKIVRPLDRIRRTMLAFERGNFAARVGETRGDELGQVATAFDRMADEVERLMSVKDELLGAVAHELRTPLARVHLALDVLAEMPRPDLRLLSDARHEIVELEGVIADVLALARASSASSGSLDVESIGLPELVEEACRSVGAAHGAAIVVREPAPDIVVEAPRRLLRRALCNVLDNAVVHGRGHAPPEVRIEADRENVRVVVDDHGPGMAPELAARAFEPFHRGDRAGAGAGLGLALARRFIVLGGGDITMATTQGRGTTVTLSLPRA